MAEIFTERTEARHPADARSMVTAPLQTAIDPESFTPRLLALLSNALVWAQSYAFREELGLSTNDWRIISALATHPGCTSKDISESLSVNKAIVSTSVNSLAEKGFVAFMTGPRNSRPLYLTRAGADMHDRMAPIARRGQRLIDDELAPDEVAALNALLIRLTDRARRLTAPSPEAS